MAVQFFSADWMLAYIKAGYPAAPAIVQGSLYFRQLPDGKLVPVGEFNAATQVWLALTKDHQVQPVYVYLGPEYFCMPLDKAQQTNCDWTQSPQPTFPKEMTDTVPGYLPIPPDADGVVKGRWANFIRLWRRKMHLE
jgi:hypothetical protein